MRRQIVKHAATFPGKVLLVHGGSGSSGGKQGKPAAIAWKGNLGDLEVADGWTKVNVRPASPALFEVAERTKAAAR